MIVLDASALVEWLLGTEAGPAVERRIAEEALQAPHLLDLEVAQTLRRYEAMGALSPQRVREALADHMSLPIRRYEHALFLERIWQLRHNLTAYDAAYVALAESLAAPLITCDRRLAAAAGHYANIEVL